ncbi:MAG: hypothetical protein CVU56_22295 [Deltaproteobacteria bacterium HGW-Deltaproteobacteria-14]|jgi:hypothetical protein|nr:MAG: hypothetical protein CVU56_22295 [Deltaproteobacteria bacterium HGW-Deltaproteobacteria-14]
MQPHLRTAALSLLALGLLAGTQACASMAGHSGGDTSVLYDTAVLSGALSGDGAETNEKGGAVIARYADLGVIAVVQPNEGKDFIRMTTLWGKDKNVIPTADWLLKINAQNRDGIVKVYLDNDADVVTEWLLEVHDGLSPSAVAKATRIFATRSREVALALADYIE